ncbi:hypothetical protein GO013_08565 [Pseudodesulfovibrio sp. JC047]|uniref:hypothetical protein n=1 Tax=Pseudodesulfovibrio sp. JC047 TaxID=2683199 RepID=UPI0013D69273|nr:hypothetical protein [Pseudodesulfovibrio sp. JC047]NDV19468.1 hypothetical protein [Pseudodesulfovibrio sp. JC047]
MTFRKLFTLVVFLAFIGLCGFELLDHFTVSAARDVENIRYVHGLDAPKNVEKKADSFNLNEILEVTDVNG